MEQVKNFNEWRAEKLGYVYFSRLKYLFIDEFNGPGKLFDYLIDIGKDNEPSGQQFAVEVKAIDAKGSILKNNSKESAYNNIAIPALLVLFDNATDKGFFQWIKKPVSDGQLQFEITKNAVQELNNQTLQEIVDQVKSWYSHKQVA